MMINIINGVLPLVMVAYLFYFRRDRGLNSLLLMTLFLSYLAFATNYESYGLDFDLYRYLHKFIGILTVAGLAHYVFKNNLTTLNNSVFYLLLMFLLAIGASYFGNDLHMTHYLHYARNFLFISSLALFIYFKLDTNKKVDELFQFIVGLVLILSIATVVQFAFNGYTFNNRVLLFFPNPNYLSLALMFGFGILLFIESSLKNIKLGIIVSAIFFTGSDAIILGVLILLLLRLFKETKVNFGKKLFINLMVVVIVGMLFFQQKLINIYTEDFSSRAALNKIALNAYNSNKVNGIGYGQFRTKFYKYTGDGIIKNSEVNTLLKSYNVNLSDQFIEYQGMTRNMEKMTHNDLIKIIAELGSFGVVFILLYFYKLYFELKKLLNNSREYFFISSSLLIGSLTFSLFHNNITSFVFWFILFLPFIINRNYSKQI